MYDSPNVLMLCMTAQTSLCCVRQPKHLDVVYDSPNVLMLCVAALTSYIVYGRPNIFMWCVAVFYRVDKDILTCLRGQRIPYPCLKYVTSSQLADAVSPTSFLRHSSLFAPHPKPQSVTSFQLTSYTRHYSVTSPQLHVAHETQVPGTSMTSFQLYLTLHCGSLPVTSSQSADAIPQTPVCEVIQLVIDSERRSYIWKDTQSEGRTATEAERVKDWDRKRITDTEAET